MRGRGEMEETLTIIRLLSVLEKSHAQGKCDAVPWRRLSGNHCKALCRWAWLSQWSYISDKRQPPVSRAILGHGKAGS
ncbi:hypothetical protein KOW79_018026 [Hemibagrus wyckioides]|uniref:Uncharacterized protein n=1 Tax=Hemibagrus wyckioides TaxID=337641 RepID=A0A9D3N8Q0_9TELE|nr:hypothetical protein KOW79_018026 [Hemibagrus wyckioides]